ncbi:TonB-dependent receptor [Sphingomonas sp. M1-B02]|uniref:TonB-dependent receptor n=1 Tax=Sphingomonas sp. M1-B02 TaxID=3114300 RepID=UPI00223EDC84|nr:TonB-dependent receptor [Sphingomonas sp. S6-11]UZK67048.1 TonB-dependent receptor [Sphingomonas sp. S6-11]
MGTFGTTVGFRALALCGTASLALLLPAAAFAQVSASDPAQLDVPQDQAGLDGTADDIVVTGIRGSLAAALNEKRSSTNIVDVINAEDVGKLPDQNLADVLENISGIQVDRAQGVGSNVSIRGSSQNLVLINGRATTPAGDARGGVSFGDVPAELIASVVVTKVATADQLEGSVGGIVDLRTYRGLGLKAPIASIRAEMEYAEYSNSFNPRISAVFGKSFDTGIGEIGVVLSGGYSNQTVREDALNVRYAARTNVDLTGDGTPDPYLRPNYAQQFMTVRERENKSLTGSAEWQPTPNLKLFVDGTYIDQSVTGSEYGVFFHQPNDISELPYLAQADIQQRTSSGFTYRQMMSGLIADTRLRPRNNSPARFTETYLAAGGGEWSMGDLVAKFEVSRAGSTSREAGLEIVAQYSDPASPNFGNERGKISPPVFFDLTDDELFFAPDRSSPLSANIANPAYYQAFIARDNETKFRNTENAQRLDLEWKAGLGPIQSIQAGIRLNQTDSVRDRYTQASATFPGFTAAARPNLFSLAPDDVFADTGRQYFGGFVAPASVTLNPAETRAAFRLLPEAPLDAAAAFRVEERSLAAYARVNIETEIGGMGLRGNAGVRYVQTDQTTIGNAISSGVVSAVTQEGRYRFWLPSAMLTLEPMRDVALRASYGRSMRRPDFAQLSPSVNFPLVGDVYVGTGNPDLRPQTVDQFDAAVEWYFDRNSLFSVGGFYKKYQDLVTTVSIAPTLINPAGSRFDPNNCATGIFNPVAVDLTGNRGVCVGTNQPQNAGSATLKGVEVAFQHSFTYLPGFLDGFGIIANYTFQEGDRDATFTVPGIVSGGGAPVQFELPLRDLSRNNYNITLFYEKYGISARVRYTSRDPFLRTEATDLSNNLPWYQDDRAQVNASISYDVNPKFAVTLSGINLTNAPSIERAIFADGPIGQYRAADRRFVLGFRGLF